LRYRIHYSNKKGRTRGIRGIYCIFLVLQLSACSYLQKKNKNEIIARVYDKEFYKEDIGNIIPNGTSSKDSLSILRNYLDNWVRQGLILHKAESNISDQLVNEDIDKQLEDYKNSLITYAYERELVRQKLDTVVTDNEIERYYNEHPDNFTLKDNIIRVLYLKLGKKDPKINKVKSWYKSESKSDRALLEAYCHQNAINYFLDDNTWLLFDDLLKEIPIKTYDEEQFLKNNRYVEIQDSSGFYLVNIKGFKIKDSLSPLSFEKENIRNMILNKRKLALIGEMEKNIYQEALKNNDFEIFIK
jgi:hypothetical protein